MTAPGTTEDRLLASARAKIKAAEGDRRQQILDQLTKDAEKVLHSRSLKTNQSPTTEVYTCCLAIVLHYEAAFLDGNPNGR